MLGVLKPTGTVITDWTGKEGVIKSVQTYYNVYFEPHTYKLFGVKIVKNSAIFTEAPMASFVFVTALLNEVFLRKQGNKYRLIVLVIAIISTISTTGYVITITAFVIKYLIDNKKGFFQVIRVLLFPILLIALIITTSQLIENKLSTVSGSIRMDDFKAGYRAWMDSPFWGNGIGNNLSFQKYMSSFRSYNLGFSNSIMNILAFGGVVLITPYILGAVFAIRYAIKNKRKYLLSFFVLFLIMFSVTLAPFQAMVIYIFVSCIDAAKNGYNET